MPSDLFPWPFISPFRIVSLITYHFILASRIPHPSIPRSFRAENQSRDLSRIRVRHRWLSIIPVIFRFASSWAIPIPENRQRLPLRLSMNALLFFPGGVPRSILSTDIQWIKDLGSSFSFFLFWYAGDLYQSRLLKIFLILMPCCFWRCEWYQRALRFILNPPQATSIKL